MKNFVLTIAAAAALAACATPGEAPKSMAPLELPAGAKMEPVPAAWWKQFGDEQLNALIEEALAHNRDLARAMARIDESRAALKLARADQLPSVSASFNNSRQRMSQNGTMPLPAGTPLVTNDHRITLDVAYELDLWGRAANATSAAREELLATEYARETLRTALIAQVVQSYAALQSLDAQRRLFGEAVEAQRESLKLQRLRFNHGDIGELDIRQLDAELIGNEAQLPKLDRARGEAERALAIVLGRSPKAMIEQQVARAGKPVVASSALPADLPSDLLLRRPDVQAAEARLRAAGAQVDAARAAYFPRIALTGSVGHESTRLSQLMSGPSLLWNVVGSITQPIWNGGRLSAQKEVVQAQQLQAELDYRDSVANAFREVRNAIAAVAETRSSADSGERRAQALLRAAELTRLRYKGGEASRLDVINAERLALTAQAANADEHRALAATQADLFRALGGGWRLSLEQ
ncbi:MAG: efflux transporter outer membrane subunit [Burkholderiales bacterium]|nr:efflux transporter outer membrane subunit [Burkholderiales bacterium]